MNMLADKQKIRQGNCMSYVIYSILYIAFFNEIVFLQNLTAKYALFTEFHQKIESCIVTDTNKKRTVLEILQYFA